MSIVRANRIEPQSGSVLQVAGRLVFTEPQPGMNLGPVNDIGAPGELGFGVGIAPNLPEGMTALSGTHDPASANYGNYQYSDGSIMCWIPAFFYKWGTGSNGLPVNSVDVQPLHAFTSVAQAAGQGYALHRAFYDGGNIKAGVFVDKYECSNNNGVASSIKFGAPLSTNGANNPISALNNTPSDNYGGALDAVKSRGSEFFCCSRFVRAALAILTHAHGVASTSTTANAWWSATGDVGPRGNNGGLALNDVNDNTVTFDGPTYDGGSYLVAKAGSASLLAKSTHNGQDSGVADLNGNLWEINPGLTYNTEAGEATGYYVLSIATRMADLAGGAGGANDAFGVAGLGNYDFAGAAFGFASDAGGSRAWRFGNEALQVLSQATSGLNWQMAGLGLPLADGASSGGTNQFGRDYVFDDGPSPNQLCPLSGGPARYGTNAGVWALILNASRASSSAAVGLRAGLYV